MQNSLTEKKLIAVTGGIGSGKSSALKILADAGYKTLSADEIVCELYERKEIRALLKPLFPTAVNGDDYIIDRKNIAEQTFSNKEKHLALTELITPMVMAEILKRTDQNELCFVEVPLLFECGFEEMFDDVIVIMRTLNKRIESVMNRSNLTKEQVMARISNQFNYDVADLSNYIIVKNDFGIDELKQTLLKIVSSL